MSDQQRHDLAAAWIAYHRLPEREAEAGNLFSAFEQPDDFVREQPEVAWPIIQELWWRRRCSEPFGGAIAWRKTFGGD